ncbi:AraC family transcriptional regulator [Actinomadura kijaniata]|uniref:AraC family transcriptional regulator n=1 Tax=Actinomadura kijaniata TaxID=46161 RepID=UPI003F1AA304
MDVLSDVITVLRTGDPRAARVRHGAPWRRELRPEPGTAALHVAVQGSQRLTLPEEGPVALDAGDVVLLPRAGRYALDGDDARTVMLCGAYRLDADRGHPLLDELPPVVRLRTGSGDHRRLRATVELLETELRDPGPGGGAIVLTLLDTLLIYVLRAWLESRPVCAGPTGWAGALADPAIRAALEAIHGDPARAWTVESLAACAGLSRAAFSRRFSALVGRPPLTYLTWWRLTTAARLLRASDAPLSAVAGRVGYGSEYAFAHAFKREFGFSPGRYRGRGSPGGG